MKLFMYVAIILGCLAVGYIFYLQNAKNRGLSERNVTLENENRTLEGKNGTLCDQKASLIAAMADPSSIIIIPDEVMSRSRYLLFHPSISGLTQEKLHKVLKEAQRLGLAIK